MGSGKKKAPKAPKAPTPPPPQNEYIWDGDTKVGEKTYDKTTNSWNTKYYKTPEQIKAEADYNAFRDKTLSTLNDTRGQDDALNQWVNSYIEKNSKPIKETADKARAQAVQNYNARGILGSSGAQDYMNNNITKLEAEGLKDVSNEATLNKEAIRQQYNTQLLNNLSAAQGGSTSAYNQGLSLGQFANSAAGTGNSISSQNYNDKLNGVMSRFNAQMQAYNGGNADGGNSWLGPSIGAAGAISAAAIPLMF